MSGGPVFDQQGGVIGVVSRGISLVAEKDSYGYAASIAGIMELKIDLEDDDGNEREFSVPELVEIGAIVVQRRGA